MSALLEVNNISKRFGGLQAVDRLSLTVNEGEILGLIGPNGAGKSTVFNLINGVAREVVDMIGLGDGPDMLAASLTTAGKKRLELARALSARPRLLLLDEVLAGLNPTETEGMIETVHKIRDSGVAILMIEHIMRAVMSLSDRIVVLNVGSKLAEGSPQQVADNPDVITAYLGDSKLLSVAEKPA
jgi:branched-chain amino acid transport system ATP-binding protein